MSVPAISAITAFQQGQGEAYLPRQSVLEIRASLTCDHPSNIDVEISVDNGSTWGAAVLHPFGSGQHLVTGTSQLIVVDVKATWAARSFAEHTFTTVKVRLTATDLTTSDESTPVTSSAITVKASRPYLASAPTMSSYIGATLAAVAPFVVDGKDYDSSESVVSLPDSPNTHLYRASTSAANIDAGTSQAFVAYTDTPTFNFGSLVEGSYTIYVRVYDKFFNASDLYSVSTYLQRSAPSNTLVQITGTNGSPDYTGITVSGDGSFTPSREITLRVGAKSTNPNIPLYFMILDTSGVELGANVGIDIPLNADNQTQILYLTTNRSNPGGDNFNKDVTLQVSIQFRDEAGNTTVTNKTIRLNTKIYKTTEKPLCRATSTYAPVIKYVNTSGAEVTIPETLILSSEPVRAWKDIFYPKTHAYPLTPDGKIDTAFINANTNLRQMLPTADYDPVVVNTATNPVTVVTDQNGRAITTNWTKDGTKNYNNLESQDLANLRSWVIAPPAAIGSYQFDFANFDLNSQIAGPPRNALCPYGGDVLVMYDATVSGAIEYITDESGNVVPVIADASKLVELAAYTGSGTNIYDLKTGTPVGSSANGEFSTPALTKTMIAFILYTDDTVTSSGFQIKAGPAIDVIYKNYHIDYTNGEIWVHMHESVGTGNVRGSAGTSIHAYYDFLDDVVTVDYTNSSVTFAVAPSGAVVVTADWTYHDSLLWSINTFLASQDDFVDYFDPHVFRPSSGYTLSDSDRESDVDRRYTGFVWNKDSGMITFDTSPASTRVIADYYSHTFQRLTNDGFGDLVFRHKVLVPDTSLYFPDYTWADVKVVNEGNIEIKDFQVRFVPRGYDTNGDGNASFTGDTVVDQVLDINRPWDIQEGTKDETFDKMAMALFSTYANFPAICPKTGGSSSSPTAGATVLLAGWKSATYASISSRGKAFGRVVWVLGGTGGSSYPSISAGRKRCSIEVQGRYYSSLII